MVAALASVDEVHRIVHHIFLPPKLPQRADEDSEIALVNTSLQALVALRDLLLPDAPPAALDNAIALVQNIKAVNGLPGGKIDEVRLQQILTSLPICGTLVANVSSQNAAVLITRRPEELVFEEFELSPLDADVVKTEGRLIRTFPGLAVAVPANILSETDFPTMIASTLSTMCHQPAPGMQPQSLKNGVLHDELRDTTNPTMVSELFMGVLTGIGSPVSASSISKNTRDEVLWKQAAAPWRRSPMWLLIRVSIQLVVCRSSDGSHALYKEIMVFIMGRILNSAKAHHLPPDVVYTMMAKIDRRLRKISGAGPPILPNSVKASIDHVLHQCWESLVKTWALSQQLDSRDLQLPTLSTLDFERDTLVALPALDDYIEATHNRRRESISDRFMPSSQLIELKPGCLPNLPSSHFNDSYAATNLSLFEQWVSRHIDNWVAANEQDNACEELHDLMVQYHRLAGFRYSGNPEATSAMVLTIFELWVACDKAALRKCPWLNKYDPGIPTDALHNLLLPFLDQMKRLFDLEDYIDRRKTRSRKQTDLLFASDSSESFASQYFDKSHTHQALLSEIVSDAKRARQAKLEEFKQVKAEYRRLDALYSGMDHEYTTKVIDNWCNPPETEEVHYPQSCQKCCYASQRNQLSIEVHEWPLPNSPYRVKAVVFELDIPSWFGNWRNARLVLLQDVLKGTRTKVKPSTAYLLSSKDPHLTRRHSQRLAHPRIDLLSQTEPVLKTHYSSKKITTLRESEICVPSGLRYKYYDAQSDEYPGEFMFKDIVPRACTYTLPCRALQRFLFRPASAPDGLEPNTVIASQDACPENTTLEEYKELGTLPLGHHIQWANILLQLAMPTLDFKKPETTLLLLQCAYQAGPRWSISNNLSSSPDGRMTLRSSHDFFSSEEKAQSLLQRLTEALQRVKSNWESSQALFIFVAIAARALSLSAFSSVHKACFAFLATSRDIAMGWVISLRDKAYAAVDYNDKTAFITKSVELALICITTFDIDSQYLEVVLAAENSASILVQASIVVQEGEHSQASEREPLLAILEMRRKRLMPRVYKILAQHPTELDTAIKKAWSAYVPGSTWRVASEIADEWVITHTLATMRADSMSVQYNLISGELLVNGLPLDQPPQAYRVHPLYSALFGKTVVEIMPSTTPGFQFSTKREFGGFSVQLGMFSKGDLIVRATKGDITYETIPSRLVEKAYPISFMQDYVHWFNVATNTVQFRPVHEPWNPSSPAVWTLSQRHIQWRLSRSERSVVGTGSLTSQRVSHVLDPLADANRIHSILQPSVNTKTLLVSIPTLRLSFKLAQGSALLECKEFRSMVVDADQSLGTLVGLRSKIVLRHLTRDDRIVLVPESKVVGYQQQNNHTSVTVSKESIHRVHALSVDPKLGRLLDNSELGCKLFLAYLHALTSFCLVDPLTHKTGTEQALTILKSAAVRSFDQLSQEHTDMLVKIADLSPGRCYYPTHLRVMQTVHWDKNISFLPQHGSFITTVKSLLKQAEQAMIFFPDAQLSFPRLERIDEHLLQRDNIRSATFRVSGFGAENHTTQSDQRYTARDRHRASQLAIRASTMSHLIFRDGVGRSYPAPAAGSLWQKMCAVEIVHGPQPPVDLSSLKYDASFIKDGYSYVLQRLPGLHRCLGTCIDSQRSKFSIMMWLSTMACEPDADLSMLQSVAMFFKSAALAQIRAPERVSFRVQAGNTCSESALSRVVEQSLRPLRSCPEHDLTRQRNEKKHVYHSRRDMAWQSARRSAVATFVNRLATQWPCEVPDTPDVPSTYIRVNEAMKDVRPLFERWYGNRLLHQYLACIEQTMSSFVYERIEPVYLTMSAPQTRPSVSGYVSERSIFLLPAPELQGYCHTVGHTLDCSSQKHGLGRPPLLSSIVEINVTAEALSSYLRSCTEHAYEVYGVLEAAVTASASSSGTRLTYQRPRVSPTFFLQQLSRSRWHYLADGWKECIVKYALALAAMQRAERLIKLTENQDLVNELQNPGHQNWDPAKHPESLLMEVESGFLVRPVQAQIAAQMQNPPDGNNAVMQLNMGEGKSSVIVPIVAAALADGEQLVRVVVAKPQFKQMTQMLISKLGGLLDRRVYYMPISRSLKLDNTAALHISAMLNDCMLSGGILLIQPEHILSFQLMTPECYILGREDVGRQLMSTLDFLEQNARDIVDESDENFSVRFELIYTMGTQRPIELSPDRWLVLQQVLDAVGLLAPGVAKDLPLSLDYHPGVSGSFPRIRILRPDAGALLLQRLADHICNNGLDGLQVSRQPEEIRGAIHSYISKVELSAAEISLVENSLFWTETTKPPLLLIRGIIACGVLEFVLTQKRWRVDYGLASRTPPTQLAVPYRAKDNPSLRSEFSHPDVVIALTSLSYYYGGLSDDDLFTAMGHLMEIDQSDVEYQAWVRDANDLPASFKQLQGINLKDRPLCTSEVFPALRLAKSVIDFFLSHIVFPKQMKEFPHKLSASGWDIGKRKSRPVTGFSGTNDSRCVLPISVHHVDHPDQKHTNALVLEYLLQPDNGVVLMEPVMQHTSDAEHLLGTIVHLTPPIQVILDVGAQILELNNIEVAKTWLKKHDATMEAAVFVNDDDELCVVDRENRVDLLRASSFFTRLDSCLIFLDEAHTRGTDLRLPSHYRAAVTLGAGLTKDRLVQACMRMPATRTSDITVADVIFWSISETHLEIRRSMPLWAVQGERFCLQDKLWQQIRRNGRTLLSKEHAETFQEKEAQSLDDRFRPRQAHGQPLHVANASDADLRLIAERCRQFDELNFNSSTLQEEQERELSPEIEQERQIQRAPAAEPKPHRLHKDVWKFAIDGVFIRGSTAYMPAFEALENSSAASDFPVRQMAGEGSLLVTADFAKTIKPSNRSSYLSDAFQRPVQWVLTSRAKGTATVDRIIIISPYEANLLYKPMEGSTAATLHVFKPRCNSGYAPMDRLDFHTITAQLGSSIVPRGLAIQLCLFSGQLYISSYEDYNEICSFLGLSKEALTQEMGEHGWKVAADGFILSDEQGRAGGGSGPYESPVGFFKILMSKIRRNGDGIMKTHMGSLLDGKIFQASEFEE
ncbi:hypothetical protein J7T55_012448 [Diaporthe amygdali]|uniref:uncharacterized protein n=1 Tax=Phomopsis amygdali TaxID=1214568 RepID=UPI0022FEB194|nr:uncharacterized protein J7T55_012448 [Diaporthe amygdali]KAJ0123975.1 hypothetical protein J7T55_012448 [Diaporthe amygdali]